MKKIALALLLALVPACIVSPEDTDSPEPPIPDVPAEDLTPVDEIKGDGASFDEDLLMDDAAFVDPFAMTQADVQAFFELTPYGTRSFFADHRHGGRLVSALLIDAAQAHRISPVVLLVKLQVEMGLVSKTQTPSQFKLDRAMGCGCFSSSDCDRYLGLGEQIDCAARYFRSYLDDLDSSGQTVSGWKVGVGKRTLDGKRVTPENHATAALYTYTPWVLRNSGGNWLYWNVYRRYTRHILAGEPNHHWIGGTCADSTACPVDGGVCHAVVGDGLCTRPCDQTCPDSEAPFTAVTFCADVSSALSGFSSGTCLSRCDDGLYPNSDGCRDGFECRLMARHTEPSVQKRVCVPSSW
ncbi:MAG: hypothetical protein JRI23_00405 [Deltaproteobacteria bacterium]|jgi:hypothetical protein|nr:hypothetical protein [Deltaproteobacteria bacterium]MBW2529903.1 hypothetical protein [Deltaproteobacteria bacterium]